MKVQLDQREAQVLKMLADYPRTLRGWSAPLRFRAFSLCEKELASLNMKGPQKAWAFEITDQGLKALKSHKEANETKTQKQTENSS